MSQPSVCAILLTADRPELTRKAVECFRVRTMKSAWLQILDTGKNRCREFLQLGDRENIRYASHSGLNGKTIGELRNEINSLCPEDILIHFDSDDISHPRRISEQVSLLQSSGADVVGYSDLLFWREPRKLALSEIPASALNDGCSDGEEPGEAWLYTSPGPKPSPPGTTLCYTREFWSRNPFPATSQGEELQFLSRAKVKTVSSLTFERPVMGQPGALPMMIGRIHPANTSTAYDPRKMAAESKRKNPAWQRVPAWDEFCRSKMCANT